MTRTELLEMAALDAFGLLDEYEAELYTRSFHHAPAAVQDEIMRLQAELVSDDSLLPVEEPSPSLRQRVLDRVAKAIEEESSELAPIGSIGRMSDRAGRSGGRMALTPSGQLWRAASFALAAAGLVLAFMFSDAYRSSNLLAEAALYNHTARLEQILAPNAKDFLFDHGTRIVLRPTAGSALPDARAAVFIMEGSNDSFLMIDGLPRDDRYRIRVVGLDDQTEDIRVFRSDGGFGGAPLGRLTAGALSAARWEILDFSGAVILSSAA